MEDVDQYVEDADDATWIVRCILYATMRIDAKHDQDHILLTYYASDLCRYKDLSKSKRACVL